MLADLDLLLTAVFCTADDLLPEKAKNARRSVTDAEVVTLAVAQAIMGIDTDREFLAVAARRLGHLFPTVAQTARVLETPARLTETIEWLIGVFAADSPGYHRPRWCCWTPRRWSAAARLRPRAARSSLTPAATGTAAATRRWFWGMRLHLLAAPDGTPRAAILAPADQKERDVALRLLPIGLHGGELVVADKGYAGKDLRGHRR